VFVRVEFLSLVCPATHDLGENLKVVVISTTEGDEKPKKYPRMFLEADVLVVNKIDLLPHVDCDTERLVRDAKTINSRLRCFKLSAKSGEGLENWLLFLAKEVKTIRDQVSQGS